MSLISAFRPRSVRPSALRRRKSKRPRPEDTPQLNDENVESDSDHDHDHSIIAPSKHTPRLARRILRGPIAPGRMLQPFRLLTQDLRNLRTRWTSDFRIFNQLIFASAVYVFFTNLLPGITFASDLYQLTGKSWGTIEVVFSTGLCGIIFSLFSVQPLTILGVTGPFSVLAENMYTLCESSFGINFLQFMAWSLIHSAWMHYVLAIFNAHDFTMQYVTTFSTEIFSLLNSIIYFHKAIQELQRAHDALSFAAFLYAIIGAIGTMLFAIFLSTAESWKPLFGKYVRLGLTEYAAAISIIVFIALPHVGELAELDKSTLVVSNSFRPTSPDRPPYFYVAFWELPSKWIAAAVIPGLIITVLFFFDHEVSSIICTIDRYGTRKPGGYAWDIVLLGTTTAMCGILGIPPANGLLPQAPLHSESLMHEEKETVPIDETEVPSRSNENDIALSDLSPNSQPTTKTVTVRRVYEQRWSALLHSCLIMAFTSPPLMKVLGLTPTSVLAGLFMFMGEQSLSVNPILYRVFYILTPISELPKLKLKGWKSDPKTSSGNNTPTNSQAPALSSLESTPESWFYTNPYIPLHIFTALQLVITIGIFIMTLSNTAAPAFPLVIVLLVPLRLMVMGRVYERMWGSIRGKSVLAFVDAWACRDGAPGADELENMEEGAEAGENIGVLSETEGDAVKGMPGAPGEEANRPSSSGNRRIDSTEAEQDISTAEAESWVELGIMETPRNQSRRAS